MFKIVFCLNYKIHEKLKTKYNIPNDIAFVYRQKLNRQTETSRSLNVIYFAFDEGAQKNHKKYVKH